MTRAIATFLRYSTTGPSPVGWPGSAFSATPPRRLTIGSAFVDNSRSLVKGRGLAEGNGVAGAAGSVVTFGEAMVRLTPPGNERLERTTSLDLTVGGAELNSAATLACLDVPVTWVSRLPDVPLGRAVARGARAADVDLTHLQWVPESAGRAGVYYLEEASDPRPSAVYYDRADSAFARMAPGTF